ncbi:hypothetical protein [Gemmatimonas sp.]|uniref:hypothetical protein n=1 Tax=Gemmatimonas sp. TaxID=1962908 RepID=UPI0035621157
MSARQTMSQQFNRTVRMNKTLIVALAVLSATGCRNALLDTPQPVARSTMELHARTVTGDTVQVTIALGSGPVRALGSVTAELTNSSDWTFVGCAAAQGEPLLACKAHAGSVRVAAAWAAGTHDGELVTLTFVRMAPTARVSWQLSLQEAHGVSGQSLLDELDVRTDVATVTGGAP